MDNTRSFILYALCFGSVDKRVKRMNGGDSGFDNDRGCVQKYEITLYQLVYRNQYAYRCSITEGIHNSNIHSLENVYDKGVLLVWHVRCWKIR